MPRRTLLLAAIAIALAAVALAVNIEARREHPNVPHPEPVFESVATVHLDDAAASHVFRLLTAKGITYGICGSRRAETLMVPREDVERVREMLRKDARERGYRIRVAGDIIEPQEQWVDQTHDAPYDQVAARPEYAGSSSVGAALRDHRVQAAAKGFPYVGDIRVWHRRFLGAEAEEPVDDVIVQLRDRLQGKAAWKQFRFQVWANGRETNLIDSY